MTNRDLDSPTAEERLEAIEDLQKLVEELRAGIASTKPIDFA
jgi:hypothetical protein